VYFGGGTPSILEPAQVARVVDACAGAFALSPDCEITLEVNPETATADRLAAFRAAGVNRLSIGVQSFRDEELARLSRLHSAGRARAAFRDARAAGFDNVSLDLMMWLPGQSVAEWLVSVDDAAALAPDHLSLYILEVYPNAPLRDEMARARWSQAPDDDAAAMYEEAMERLELAGYVQYEISNVARPGRCSRHNLKYWSDGEWIGLGCGAHSTLAGVRWKNVSATDDYIARLGRGASTAVDVRRLSAHERVGEALMTGLRLADGVDEAGILARYGVDVWATYGPDLAPSLEAGLLMRKNGRMSLTRRGMLLAHEVMVAFV
jgi:oxygen-independent coproporphyrinogen-3 oxidase